MCIVPIHKVISNVGVLPFLMRISLQLNEEMAPLIVKLITTALSGVPFNSKTDSHKHSHQSSKGTSKSTDSSAKAKAPSTKQPGTSVFHLHPLIILYCM